MKRFLTAVLTIVLLLALAVPAAADVLWTPVNDSFFESHYEECTHEGRNYYANGPEGFVTLWKAPESGRVVAQFENGQSLTVNWIYEDWGCVNARVKDEWIDGWVPMKELRLIYDHISFAEEYAHRITPYSGEFSDFDDDGATVNFYKFPGSPDIVRSNYMFEYDIMEMLVGTKDSPSYIQNVFVDEQGLTWGFVGYMRGRMNAWFCLDDPGITVGDGAGQVPARDIGAADLQPAREPVLPRGAYLPYVLVGAVAVGTGAALGLLRKKKK